MSGNEHNEEKTSEKTNAYTPGLKVKRSEIVQKNRRLPIHGDVEVKEGDIVKHDTIIARTQLSGEPEIIKAYMLLDIEAEDLPNYMKYKEGETVKKGEILAAYSALFGLIKKQIESPIDGTIESISDMTGQIILRRSPIPVDVESYIPGRIIKVLPNEGATIETHAAIIQGIIGVGGESHGEIKVVVDSPRDELTAEAITPEDAGKVIIGGRLVTLPAIRKAVENGVSCIVSGGIHHEVLKEFIGEEIGVAITGQEELGITLIITEGFGKMTMSQNTFNLLRSFNGYEASVNGATQIRAGVLRPEIIIPHQDVPKETHSSDLSSGITAGTLVRIIRQPYFGDIAKVITLPVELQRVQTGSLVRVVKLELEDGSIVTVPRANVEIIEE